MSCGKIWRQLGWWTVSPQESLKVLSAISAAWPRQVLSKATSTLWAEVLCRQPPGLLYEDVLEAVRRLVEREPRMPALSAVLEEARCVRRERVEQQEADLRLRALPEHAHLTAEQTARVEALRRRIREQLARLDFSPQARGRRQAVPSSPQRTGSEG